MVFALRVVAFPRDVDGPGFYRVGLPLRGLNGLGRVAGIAPHRFDGRVLMFDLFRVPAADVYVVQMPHEPQWLDVIGEFQQHGTVVVDADDLLDEMPSWHPAAGNKVFRDTALRAIALADRVTVSTPFLADRYSRLNANVSVVPNRLDGAMWDVPQGFERDGRRVRVGWMGRAAMRAGDIRVLQGVIGPWLERNPQVEFVAAGDPSVHDLLGVPEGQRVTAGAVPFQRAGVPLLPYITACMDIGLVPLEGCAFNDAKSALKGMEYGACGIPCVASPSAEYRGWVEPGVNGLLAKRPKDWVAALDLLVNDGELRRAMGRNARAKAEQHFFTAETAELWEAAYAGERVYADGARQRAAA